MGQDSNLQGHKGRPGSGRVPSASRIAHPSRNEAESDPGTLGARLLSGQVPSPIG
jgi:hypothetical protein